MKKVSIVVPLYKSEKFMVKLIDSIINQSYKNFELILVDDESPDNSGRIADEYASQDSRILSFHKKNGGCCDARNFGLQHVTGDYLMLADGDDWMEPDCIEYLVSLAENNNCQMAMSDCIFTTVDRHQNEIDNIRVWNPERATCGILYVETPVGPWNKLYTTEVIRNNNIDFSVPWFGEGLYFSCTAAQFSNSVAVGHRKVYNYRLNNTESGTTVREVKHAINSMWNIRNIKNHLHVRTSRTINAANWHIHRNCFNLLWYINDSNNKEEYKDLYSKTRKEILQTMPTVFLHSDVGIGKKAIIVLTSIFPHFAGKLAAWRRSRLMQGKGVL